MNGEKEKGKKMMKNKIAEWGEASKSGTWRHQTAKQTSFWFDLKLTRWCIDRATEMDITMIGLQNAGKTSLLRVLAVSFFLLSFSPPARYLSLMFVWRR